MLMYSSLPLSGHFQVASKIVRGLERGDFCITFGAEGYFLGLGTAGFSPSFSVMEAISQVRSRDVCRCRKHFLRRSSGCCMMER